MPRLTQTTRSPNSPTIPMTRSSLILLLLLTLALPASTKAQQTTPADADSNSTPVSGTVTIAADRMEFVLRKTASLEGNVEVVFTPQGETLAQFQKQVQGDDVRVILNADRMTVLFPEGGEGAGSRPQKIQAFGKVRIHTPDGKSATGDQGLWDLAGGSAIILEGDCTVLADGRVLTSSRITYDLKENRFQAARAVLTLPVESSPAAADPTRLLTPAAQE